MTTLHSMVNYDLVESFDYAPEDEAVFPDLDEDNRVEMFKLESAKYSRQFVRISTSFVISIV
jgi:hypothetical protein